MNGKLGISILIVVFAPLLQAEDLVVPRPEGDYLTKWHKGIYETFEKTKAKTKANAQAEVKALDKAFSPALQERLLTLAASLPPERIRELRKTSSAWKQNDGSIEIKGQVPAELAELAGTHRENVRCSAAKEAYNMYFHAHWVVRQLDKLALQFEKEKDLESMRHLRAEARALMSRVHRPVEAYGPLQLSGYWWGKMKASWPKFTRMQRGGGDPELISICRINGNFVGGGESVKIQVWDEGGLPGLFCFSSQPHVWVSAYALRHPALRMKEAKVWTEDITAKTPRKRLIHSDRGFCYFGGMGGHIGELTHGTIEVDPDDGFYYLDGRFENHSTSIRAVIVEYPEGRRPEFEITHAEWKRGDPVHELIPASEGICLLTGINGRIKVGDDELRLVVGSEGNWRLGGRTERANASAKAMVMRFKGAEEE